MNYVESIHDRPRRRRPPATKETASCTGRAACVGREQLRDPATQAAADQWVVDARAELAAAQAQLDNAGVDRIVATTEAGRTKQETLQAALGLAARPRSPPPTARSCS